VGIANSLAALDAGANRIDGSVAGVGAGAGNTPLEELVAVLDRDALTWGTRVSIVHFCFSANGREKPMASLQEIFLLSQVIAARLGARKT